MDTHPVVRIFTFKEGLLSALAHDLQLILRTFDIELDQGTITARFELESLLVEGAVKGGRLNQRTLSPSDCAKIRKNALNEVLRVDRHPQARFEGTLAKRGGAVMVEGSLDLAGRRCAIRSVPAKRRDGSWMVGVELTPSRWGIRPYRAMGGTLRLQDRVRVEVSLPVEENWDYEHGKAKFSGVPA